MGNSSAHLADDVTAVSEANGTTVPLSLDLRSSLSIQPLEGSRSRVRRTRGAMGIQSIFAWKALPDGGFAQNVIIEAHRCRTSRNHLRHPTAGTIRSSRGQFRRLRLFTR